MPKKKAKKVKQLKTVKQITVRSRAYGEHTRAARGSIKPAVLNDALLIKSKQVAVINALASEVHLLLKHYAGLFKESMLWQKMLSRMHAVKVVTVSGLLNSLKGLQLNSRYPMYRFGNAVNIHLTLQRNGLRLQVLNNFIPHFSAKINSYCYDVMVLFFNAKGKTVGDSLISTQWFRINEVASNAVFDVAIHKTAKFYMLCLHVQGGKNGEAVNELTSQAMEIVQVGEVGA